MLNESRRRILVLYIDDPYLSWDFDLIIQIGVDFCRILSRDFRLINGLKRLLPDTIGNKEGQFFSRLIPLNEEQTLEILEDYQILRNANIIVRTDYFP